ncbi:hypothetical protein J6590_100807 [Homalodisca vitripennis]|nr:hypothetical protein J6590_100807 [Homalodisca vitripennis]
MIMEIKYMGTWYQKETYGTELFQGTGKCVSAMYSINPDTGVVDVFNSQEPVSGGWVLFQVTEKCVVAMYSLNPDTRVVDVFNSQEPVRNLLGKWWMGVVPSDREMCGSDVLPQPDTRVVDVFNSQEPVRNLLGKWWMGVVPSDREMCGSDVLPAQPDTRVVDVFNSQEPVRNLLGKWWWVLFQVTEKCVVAMYSLNPTLELWTCSTPRNLLVTEKCVVAMYSINPDTGVVDVFNSQEPVSSSSTARSINGTAVLEDSNKMEGKLLVTFPIAIIQRITSKYWVLDTDYSNWAVVWSCFSLGSLAHSESAWILVRHRDGAKEDSGSRDLEIDSVLNREGIPRSRFKKTDQENCLMQ